MFTLQLIQRAAFELIVLPAVSEASKSAAIASFKVIRWAAHITINVCEFLLVWLFKLAVIATVFFVKKAKEHGPVVLTYAAKLPSADALPGMAIDAGVSTGMVIKPWAKGQIRQIQELLETPWKALTMAVSAANLT